MPAMDGFGSPRTSTSLIQTIVSGTGTVRWRHTASLYCVTLMTWMPSTIWSWRSGAGIKPVAAVVAAVRPVGVAERVVALVGPAAVCNHHRAVESAHRAT